MFARVLVSLFLVCAFSGCEGAVDGPPSAPDSEGLNDATMGRLDGGDRPDPDEGLRDATAVIDVGLPRDARPAADAVIVMDAEPNSDAAQGPDAESTVDASPLDMGAVPDMSGSADALVVADAAPIRDAAPTPDAGEPQCVQDADCAAGQVCRDGVCEAAPPECIADVDCGADRVCRDGVCEAAPPECVEDADCGADRVCRDGVCEAAPPECIEDAECGADRVCRDGVCEAAPPECVEDVDCGARRLCRGGRCEDAPPECVVDGQCGVGRVCIDGQCEVPPPECVNDEQCPEDHVCREGSCEAIPPECVRPEDCDGGGRCRDGECLLPACDDGLQNAMETDVDCGGECAPCGEGLACVDANDCLSLVCDAGRCSAPSCDDSALNGSETDVDCGGVCAPCIDAAHCLDGTDCQSGRCVEAHCAAPTCDDAFMNGAETDVDCGGQCPACADGERCAINGDCVAGNCLEDVCQPAGCGDDVRNGTETDVDCGGAECAPCEVAQACAEARDCDSVVCTDGRCQAPACDDGVRNGQEVDVDCGADCAACLDGRQCGRALDCASQVCRGGVCAVPACDDGILNGAEVDVDCGAECARCAPGAICRLQADCASGVCDGGRCQAPTCEDGVSNGQETGDDCGGNCDSCAPGQGCLQPTDCQSAVCAGRLCMAPACDDGVRNGQEVDVDCGGPCSSCSCSPAAVVALGGVGVIQGTTQGAFNFEDASCASSGQAPEIVHAFTPAAAGVYCASTAGSNFDTVLYLRRACDDVATEDACNDAIDYPNDHSSAFDFVADAGAPLFLVVDGYSGEHGEQADRGEYTLTVSAGRCDGGPVCQNDDQCDGESQRCDGGLCVDVPIPCEGFGGCPPNLRCQNNVCQAVGGSTCGEDGECGFERRCVNASCEEPPPTGSCRPDRVIDLQGYGTIDGTTLGGESSHSGNCRDSAVSGEVVHRFSVPEATEVCVHTEGSGFDTVAYVRSSCAQQFAEAGCNDDSPRGGQSSEFSFFAFGGQDFFIFVDGDDTGPQGAGDYRLTVAEGPCPQCAVNADCPDRQICADQRCQPTVFEEDVVISEIHIGQGGPQSVELHNPTDRPKDLVGCVLESGDSVHPIGAQAIDAGGYLVLTPLDIVLAPRPSLRVRCHVIVVDAVDFSQNGFPEAGSALSLSDDLMTADGNDDGRAWCVQDGSLGAENPHCDRCSDNPCPAANPPFCRGNAVVTNTKECSELQGRPDVACVNGEDITDCGEAACVDGVCVRAPQPGDLVISEIMYNPEAVNDSEGEWIEIYNATGGVLSLDGCDLRDDAFSSAMNPVMLAAGGYAVFGRNADPAENGGVTVDGVFTFSLNNVGERLRIQCGDSMIDAVNYGQEGFVGAEGLSLNLGGDLLTAQANNSGLSWCHGVTLLNGPGSDRGSPGGPNPVCGGCNPNRCVNAPAPRCDGDLRVVSSAPGVCELEFGQPMCTYPQERIPCPAGEVCEGGACVVPLVGCMRDGCALGQICNRDTAECEAAAAAGTCGAPTLIDWSPADGAVLNLQGSTAGAASAIGDATCGEGAPGPEAVYRITLDREAVVCVTTDSPHLEADTVLHIRTTCDDPSSELEPPDAIGCNDDIGDWDNDGNCDSPIDGCRVPSELQLNGLEAQTYYVIVDSDTAGVATNYDLSFLPGPCPLAPAPIECAVDLHCLEGDVCFNGLCTPPPGPEVACEPERAIELAGPGRYEGSTDGAPFAHSAGCAETDEMPEVAHRIRFEQDTPVCVSTVGSSFDTVISVRRNGCVGNEVICNDDITEDGPSQSKAEFNAVAGTDYFIVVDGWNLALPGSGDYVLDVAEGRCADAPGPCAVEGRCPGTCLEPTVIDQFGEWEENTVLAGAAIDTHACSNAVGPEAIYQLQFAERTTVCVSTFGSDPEYDTVLSVRNDCRSQVNTLACSDDYAEHTVHSEVELDLEEGDTPFVVVDSLAAGGDFLLSVTEGRCPTCRANEDCPGSLSCIEQRCVECQQDNECGAGLVCQEERCVFPPCDVDADCGADQICSAGRCAVGGRGSCDEDVLVSLDGLGVHQGTTVGARNTIEAGCAATGASPEVAHELIFPANQTVCVSTEGSDFDTVASVRTNCTGFNTQLKCDDDGVSGDALTSKFTLNALANVPYFIVVDGKDAGGNAVSGDYTLTVSDGACPVCAQDADCAGDRVCEANQCVECRGDEHCPGDQVCQNNRCDIPLQVCDEQTPCRPDDLFSGAVGQDCDLTVGPEDAGLCVDRGMCRNPIPFQIGDLVDGENIGRESVYLSECGGRGGGAEVIYTFEAPADGQACFTVVDADYDVVIYLKDICADNPAVFGGWQLDCADVAGDEPPGAIDDRFTVDLTGGEAYYFVVDANDQDAQGTFTLFSHYGQCGAVPAPQCQTNADCALGQRCTEQRQCVTPIGSCEDPVQITELGTYSASLRTAPNLLEPTRCDACVNPGGGRCGESVYHYQPERGGPVCVTTAGSNFDTVLYVRAQNCAAGQAEIGCNDDVDNGSSFSTLQFQAQAGVDYYIVADSWAGPGRLELTVSEGACP